MPIIRKKADLFERAIEHRRLDHVKQGTYGDIKFLQNGEAEVTEWKGCAISCLATETTVEGLFEQEAKGYFSVINLGEADDGRTIYDVSCDSSTLRDILSDEFNICRKLVWLAEIIFEGSSEEYAMDWPVEFVDAIPENVDITDADVDKFWKEVIVPRGINFIDYFPVELNPDGYVNINSDGYEEQWSLDEYFEVVDERDGELLLDWLRSLAEEKKNTSELISV